MTECGRQTVSQTIPVIPRESGESSTPRHLDSITGVSGILDRPPARTMTPRVGQQTRLRLPAARFARVLLFASRPQNKGRREGRVPAGTHGPLCACSAKRTAQRHTGEAEHTAFPAQWLDGLCRALPGAEFLLASLAPRIDDAVRPVGLAHISATGLTVATTARTTRFCRTHQRRSSARGHGLTGTTRPARTLFVPTLPRPPQPDPRLVTTYDRPFSPDQDSRHLRQIRISVKRNISMPPD
jgi:hypothetical protein